ncbi:MAG: sodium:solute symporter [Verrucomicrobiales bacterium]|nr:sodium:solute symporter [Verrucomicrobiales bacterium]MCP5528725.1 sodium:solute symporter [Verrucomicrobiales bacterium]
MNGSLPVFDLSVLALYLVGTVLFGLWMGRRSGTPENFMAAGGSLPGWAVGLSIFGTFVSSISFLALPGKAVSGDWNPFVFSLTIPVAAWLAVRFFVPFYRRSGAISAYEHLEHRFGSWARIYAVACYLLTQLGRMGTIMYLVALALHPLTGWSVRYLILVTGVLVVVYAMFGGITAVIWTDVVQSIVLIGGALACVAILLFGMPEGPGQIFAMAREHGKFSLGSLAPDLAASTFWVVLLYGVFMNLQNFGIDQSFVQRYHTARTDAEAGRSVWTGALLYLPISAFFLFIGTGLYAFYTARPDRLPVGLDLATTADKIFPHFIVAELPAGLTGLVIAAIFAAAQSTVSSSVNCAATLIGCDIYRRHLKPDASEREMMGVLRGATLAVGLLGTLAALAMIRIKSALDVWWDWAGVASGGMLGLFLLGIIARRARNAAAASGVLAGILVITWMTVSTKSFWPAALAGWRSPFHSFMTIVVGTTTILLVGFLVTLLVGPKPGGAPAHERE